MTPELLATGIGQNTFTPPRTMDDPAIAALAQTFAYNDGIAVLHETIQYLVERSENEREWLEALARSPVSTTLVWGLYDEVSPLRVAAYVWNTYLSTKPGDNEFWLLPRANHYLQEDQPQEFAEVVSTALAKRSPGLRAPSPRSRGLRSCWTTRGRSCPRQKRCWPAPERRKSRLDLLRLTDSAVDERLGSAIAPEE